MTGAINFSDRVGRFGDAVVHVIPRSFSLNTVSGSLILFPASRSSHLREQRKVARYFST
ncbi:hypothetical protein H2509_12070 [Stappia sp. F7233]|uniref:Uncharacterized protein n=1 Tax=Stappia albiluteola TaxID=2758565 RepID=A0A839AH55_9HYPH|nr:hypothetical protein [Stappia albiluteola]MBA5777859.1 hypothetical protein [Stappia albiluteola]